MKKLTIILALATIAALAAIGQINHPSTPLFSHGTSLATTQKQIPFPSCPPNCK